VCGRAGARVQSKQFLGVVLRTRFSVAAAARVSPQRCLGLIRRLIVVSAVLARERERERERAGVSGVLLLEIKLLER
jgi:hypothetical protein